MEYLTFFSSCSLRWGEGDVAEHVFLASGGIAELGLSLGKDVLGKGVGVEALDGLLVAEDLGLDLGIDGGGGTAVLAAAVSLQLSADILVALAREDVLHGLGADELGGRGDQRGIAHVGAHARGLEQGGG